MSRRVLDLAWSLAIVLALCARTPAARASSDDLRQRSQKIANMTAVERDRLNRNWVKFQSLSDERKQRYRDLHQKLLDDEKSGGQLTNTMQTYAAWLQTLRPGWRAELREATDPQKKLELVKEFAAKQEANNESRALNDPVDGMPWFRRSMRGRTTPLSGAELEAVMDALADQLSGSQRDELQRLSLRGEQWTRYRRIMEMSVEQAGGGGEWPSKEQDAAMLAAIRNSDAAAKVDAIQDAQLRRMRWWRLILSSFDSELQKQREPYQPKPGDLQRLFEGLGPAEREELMGMERPGIQWKLTGMYFRNLSETNAEYREFVRVERGFRDFLWRFMADAGVFGRGGGPGQGGPGDRRGGFRPPGPPRDARGDFNGPEGPPPRGFRGEPPPRRDDDRGPPGRPPQP